TAAGWLAGADLGLGLCRGYTKPSISMKPSKEVPLGRSVSVWCRGQGQGLKIVLNKERRHFSPVDSDGSEVVFSITNVSREDGGSYSCSYHSRSEPFAVSYTSDPVELVVRGEGPGSVPTGFTVPGANVTIRCQGQRRNVMFFLHKPGDLNPQRPVDPAGDGAEFLIPTAGLQHKGKYNCSYRPQSEPFVSSEPSDSVELVVAGEGPVSTSPLPAPHPARPSRGRPPQAVPRPGLNEAGAAGEAVAWWTQRWAGTQEIWPSSWCGHGHCVMEAHHGFQKCPSLWRGLNLQGSQAERPQTEMPTISGDLCKRWPQ
uniref:Ig-like domain-containing protein n=1 Tax=Terrapene triunguis TaxID=2587831 RepID=A0A674IR10_9SAUR